MKDCVQMGIKVVSLWACLHMKPMKGHRVGIIAWGRGPSVITADNCEYAGLVLSPLPIETRQELGAFIFEPGSSLNTPVDSPVLANPSPLRRVIETVARSRATDVLIVRLPFAVARSPFDLDVTDAILEAVIRTRESIDVPLAIVRPHTDAPETSGQFFVVHRRCAEADLPLFSTTHRAAQGIGRFIDAATAFG